MATPAASPLVGLRPRTYHKDYDNGIRSEKECHPYIEEYLNQKITPTENRYSKFDWENETTLAELKTRRMCRRGRWPTAYVGKTKWDAGIESVKEVYFFFRFADGLHVYKQNTADNFEIVMVANRNRDRYTRASACVCIPVDRLEHVADVPPKSNVAVLD